MFAKLTYPNGREVVRRLWDSGSSTNRDETRGDGIFSGRFYVGTPGAYGIQMRMRTRYGGERIKLSDRVSTDVANIRMKLISRNVLATKGSVLGDALEEDRYGLPLVVQKTRGTMPEVIKTRAEVWAKDLQGNDVVVGWTGGMVEPKHQRSNRWIVPFTFHTGWLDQDDYTGPLELRNIEASDLNTQVSEFKLCDI